MKVLEDIAYKKSFLIDKEYNFDNHESRIYLEKTFHKYNGTDQYFLKLMQITSSGNLDCIGYIYFYIDFLKLESKFIGIYVKPEYRNNGIASLLVSNWIKLCLDNGIYNLETNKKQRKPALLYLLKNYFFEIENPETYITSPFTIDICEGIHDKTKYLYFKNEEQKQKFIHSTIMQEGNYYILDELTNAYRFVDNVLISNPYYIQDDNAAYTRSLKNIERKKTKLI